jgi:hypothetical protein
MSTEVKEIEKKVERFRISLKHVDCSLKQEFYWKLLEECMEKSFENVSWVGEKYRQFVMGKIDEIDKKRRCPI